MSGAQGKVVLITGAARGIGAATAVRLASRGAKLVLTDLDAEPLRELAERLGPDAATSIVGDVTELADMEAAVAHAVERFGGLDVVVANAGIAPYGSVAAVDPATFRRVIDINVTGIFNTVRPALPQLIQRRGYVLVVSSAAAYAAAPGLAAYHASKAGAEHFANALRLELGYRGVAVGSAHMSWIDTPMVQDAKDDLSAFRQMLAARPDGQDDLGRGVRRGLRARHRKALPPRQRAGLGRHRPLAEAAAHLPPRRPPRPPRRQAHPPPDG